MNTTASLTLALLLACPALAPAAETTAAASPATDTTISDSFLRPLRPDDPREKGNLTATVALSPEERDRFVGWYRFRDGNGYVPILKRDGAYFSVGVMGAEVPMTTCTEGLEWGLLPSSMKGTRFVMTPGTGQCSLAIHDSQLQHMSDDYVAGRQHPLVRADKPAGLPDPTTRRPVSNDDFVGCYQFAWLPQVRFEIRREGDGFVGEGRIFADKEGWQREGGTVRLSPLPDRLGFTQDEQNRSRLIYNEVLRRFEMAAQDAGREPEVVRIPLARIASSDLDAPPPKVDVGIPSWH